MDAGAVVAAVRYAVPIDVRVAGIPDPVVVGVELRGVRVIRAVVVGVQNAVLVGVVRDAGAIATPEDGRDDVVGVGGAIPVGPGYRRAGSLHDHQVRAARAGEVEAPEERVVGRLRDRERLGAAGRGRDGQRGAIAAGLGRERQNRDADRRQGRRGRLAEWARVAGVAEAVAVRVQLVGVRHPRAVVVHVEHAVQVIIVGGACGIAAAEADLHEEAAGRGTGRTGHNAPLARRAGPQTCAELLPNGHRGILGLGAARCPGDRHLAAVVVTPGDQVVCFDLHGPVDERRHRGLSRRTGVARVAEPVAVAVDLPGVGDLGAVVVAVVDAVLIGIRWRVAAHRDVQRRPGEEAVRAGVLGADPGLHGEHRCIRGPVACLAGSEVVGDRQGARRRVGGRSTVGELREEGQRSAHLVRGIAGGLPSRDTGQGEDRDEKGAGKHGRTGTADSLHCWTLLGWVGGRCCRTRSH